MGTAAVDMMANTRILKVACHVDILATVNWLDVDAPTCVYQSRWVTAADPRHLQ
jgi:hypothetical protein